MSQAIAETVAVTTDGASVTRLCRAAGLSRASYYRHHGALTSVTSVEINHPGTSGRVAPQEVDRNEVDRNEVDRNEVAVRDMIQQIALEMSAYGYRRITKELHRRGVSINHKRVLHLMREDNLLCLRKEHFIATTDSAHAHPVHPNLAAALTVTGLDQLWVADLTYIRLQGEFVYLAILLDAYSRRVIGWELNRHLDARLTVAALNMALATRTVTPGLVHHSDRGVQYACGDYTALLLAHGIQISMSRRGNPYDNAQAESFMKTLKWEEVYLAEYQNLHEARRGIGSFIEAVYNRKRLHSSLDYLPPVELEQQLQPSVSLTVP
jgi:putative transposase